MTTVEVYSYIRDYAERKLWISDIAGQLGISYRKANHLCLAAGFSRGKIAQQVPLSVFSADPYVQAIAAEIK